MNQQQRDYLAENVNKVYDRQKEILERKKPKRPSLNNYMVSAVLDGSIKYRGIEHVKEVVKQRVIDLGREDAFVQEDDDKYWRRRHNRDDDDDDVAQIVKIRVEDLFVLPKAYLDAVAKYEKARDEIQEKVDELREQRDTILLKIRIGSNESLDRLIQDVDNLADLRIINKQLSMHPVAKLTAEAGKNDEQEHKNRKSKTK